MLFLVRAMTANCTCKKPKTARFHSDYVHDSAPMTAGDIIVNVSEKEEARVQKERAKVERQAERETAQARGA